MSPARLVVNALVRTAVVLAVVGVIVVWINSSETTDALGAGLLAFFVLIVLAFVWALVDGVLRGFVPALVGWVLTAVFSGIGIPVALALANDNELGFDAEDALFFGLLLLIPAVVGLAIGAIVHRFRGGSEAPVTG